MAIYPSTYVSLLKNVPLDADYNHTLYFATQADQTAYFGSLAKMDFNPQTYQRVGTNQIRVNAPMNTLYQYGYLRFINQSYENKWFYAFITNVEYVNDNCSLITYKLDVMQTFMFDYTLCDCFIERAHTLTDGIGDHIEPEPFGSTEMVFNERYSLIDYSDCCVIIAVSQVNDNVSGSVYDYSYSGCTLYAFEFRADAGLIGVINQFLTNYLQTSEEVVNIYLCPKALVGNIPQDHILPWGKNASGISEIYADSVGNDTRVDGYLPKNKKLLTYPFNYAMVDNNNAQSMTLRYEFFDNLTPCFQTMGAITSPVVVNCYPKKYKVENLKDPDSGLPVQPFALTTECVSISNFPLCSWAFDSYKIWQSREMLPSILNFAMPFSRGERGFSTPNRVGNISNVISAQYYASIQSDICRGTTSNTGNLNNANSLNKFMFSRVSVNENQARIIDDYFNMFGYAINRVEVPVVNRRPHWNYIKTLGCQINTSIPQNYANAIRSIYDNGITFWKNPSEVGQYWRDNSPS